MAQIADGIGALSDVDLEELDGPSATALIEVLHGLADRLTAVTVLALPVIESDGRWALEGARTFPVWLAGRLRTSVSAARRDVRLGRALRDELPLTARAVAAGEMTLEHARAMATTATTSEARRAALRDPESACNEAFLVQQAAILPADPFRRVVRGWAAAADPDADDRGYRDSADREFLDVAQTLGGYHLAGFLTEEHGTVLATALASVSGVPAADDVRTAPQRRAQALHDLARLTLDHGLTGTGAAVRPHLSVHVDLERLTAGIDDRSGADAGADRGVRSAGHGEERHTDRRQLRGPVTVATLDDGTPVPPVLFERLACDSEVTRIVFGPKRCVLDVGRAERTVTGQLRRAVIARDRRCRYPGCDAPPAMSEVHHPHHWADGGVTSITNSIMLCWHHHEVVHRMAITASFEDGGWVFRRRDTTVTRTAEASTQTSACAGTTREFREAVRQNSAAATGPFSLRLSRPQVTAGRSAAASA